MVDYPSTTSNLWINPASTGMSYVYEIWDTRREHFTETEFTATVQLRCPWAQRHTLIEEIRGGQVSGEDAAPGIPYPEKQDAYFINASIAPLAAASPAAPDSGAGTISKFNYDEALVTVNYSTNMARGRYVESLEPIVDMQVLSWRDYRWLSDGGELKDPKEAPSRQVRAIMYTVEMFNVPRNVFSAAAYASTVGKVNDDSLTLATFGTTYDQDQVLLIPSQVKCQTVAHADGSVGSGEGGFYWNYALKYAIRPTQYGWNGFWRQSTQAYGQLRLATGGGAIEVYPRASIGDFLPGELLSFDMLKKKDYNRIEFLRKGMKRLHDWATKPDDNS